MKSLTTLSKILLVLALVLIVMHEAGFRYGRIITLKAPSILIGSFGGHQSDGTIREVEAGTRLLFLEYSGNVLFGWREGFEWGTLTSVSIVDYQIFREDEFK